MIAWAQIVGGSTAYKLASIAVVGFIVIATLGGLALASVVIFGQLKETSRRLKARKVARGDSASSRSRQP